MRPVSIGQRYETVNAPWLVWEVVEIIEQEIAGTHVVLRRIGDPRTTKTVSPTALSHARSYRLISVT